MAETYWLTFRIHNDTGYNTAYEALIAAVKKHVNGQWWYDTTAFYLFASSSSIDQIAASVKAAIRPDRDLVVVGKAEYKTGRVIGHNKDADIYDLVPFMKKV